MKLEVTEKIIARIDTPRFEKHHLFGISVGGDGNKWFGFTRGDNFGTLGICGVYLSFRLPYQPSIVFGQGVDAGFNASAKTVAYLISKINHQSVTIKNLIETLEEIQNQLDEEEDEDGFKPNWN